MALIRATLAMTAVLFGIACSGPVPARNSIVAGIRFGRLKRPVRRDLGGRRWVPIYLFADGR